MSPQAPRRRHGLPAAAILVLLAGLAGASAAAAEDAAPAETPAAVTAPAEPPPEVDPHTVPATLMMSVEDMIAVERAIAAGPLARLDGRSPEVDPDRFKLHIPLYLSAIVYRRADAWTIWINGRAFTPRQPADLFDIVDVGPESVRLAIPWGAGGRRDVLLAPHQTFVPRLGTVVEGHWG
jgi:hypothetical protein